MAEDKIIKIGEDQIKKEVLDKYKHLVDEYDDGTASIVLYRYPFGELGCPGCGSMDYEVEDTYHNGAFFYLDCYTCNSSFEIIPDEAKFEASQEQIRLRNQLGKPHCPTCNSTNVKTISTTKRMTGLFFAGLASSNLGKTMECKNCGYKW